MPEHYRKTSLRARILRGAGRVFGLGGRRKPKPKPKPKPMKATPTKPVKKIAPKPRFYGAKELRDYYEKHGVLPPGYR